MFIKIKGENRINKRQNSRRKWIKHGEGEIWGRQVDLQNKGISKQWKKKTGLISKRKRSK